MGTRFENERQRELSRALVMLGERRELREEEARAIVAVIDTILRSEDSNFEWDDAWDGMRFLCPAHRAMAPFLAAMIRDLGMGASRDRYARLWALRAAAKLQLADPELREAAQSILDDGEHSARAFFLDRNAKVRLAARALLSKLKRWS